MFNSSKQRTVLATPCVATKGSDFVGLKINGTQRQFTFPMGFAKSWEVKNQEAEIPREDILLLIKRISQCENLKGERICQINGEKGKEDFPITSMLFLIEDFLDKGTFYTEKEKIIGHGLPGKISWNRTIKQIKPVVSERGIAFLDFIVRKSRIKQDQLITELHKYCVFKSFELLGFLYTSAMPEKGLLTENEVQKNQKYYTGFLSEKIAETHLESSIELFSHIRNVIRNFNFESKMVSAKYGTESFHVVWESMIDSIYGTISKDDKRKYFNPRTRWNFSSSSSSQENAPLRPDTIMLTDENSKCFILDSKYYSFGTQSELEKDEDNTQEDVSSHGTIPGSDSIQKQITYAEYIDKNRTAAKDAPSAKYKFDSDKIFNAFLLPGYISSDVSDAGIEYIGYAIADWNSQVTEKYRCVHAFNIDVKKVMQKCGHQDANAVKYLADEIEKASRSI